MLRESRQICEAGDRARAGLLHHMSSITCTGVSLGQHFLFMLQLMLLAS